MKITFKYILLFGITLLPFSCSDKEVEPPLIYPSFIAAGIGQNTPGIIYTDIEPVPRILRDNFLDTPIYDEFEIDIDQDGIEDFLFIRSRIYDQNYDSLRIRVIAYGDNEVAIESLDEINAAPLAILDTIDSKTIWGQEESILLDIYANGTDTTSAGVWQDQIGKYIGTRIRKNDNYLYGWIQLSCSSDWGDNLVLFEYATTVGYSP